MVVVGGFEVICYRKDFLWWVIDWFLVGGYCFLLFIWNIKIFCIWKDIVYWSGVGRVWLGKERLEGSGSKCVKIVFVWLI